MMVKDESSSRYLLKQDEIFEKGNPDGVAVHSIQEIQQAGPHFVGVNFRVIDDLGKQRLLSLVVPHVDMEQAVPEVRTVPALGLCLSHGHSVFKG